MSLIATYQGVTDEKPVQKAILLSDVTTLKTLYRRMRSDLLIVESDDISTPDISYAISSDGKYYTCNGGTYDGEFMPIKSLIDGVFVTRIGKSAFKDNSSFSTLILPERLETLSDKCFYDCNELNSMVFPKTLQYIGTSAFDGCSSLTSVVIPDSVTTLGAYAFSLCRRLTSVIIGNGVTSISDSTFRHCNSLRRVTIGDSVTSIGAYAFSDCEQLTSITFAGTVAQWNAITKDNNWKYDSPITKVICTGDNGQATA